MSSIGGLSSNANSASSIRGYGGLASGLDRDSLIESMTYATTSKITKQQQAKQKIAWRQEAMRGITDKLYNFSQGFISYTSSKSLLSTKLYRAGTVETKGANAKYISVTGNSSMADSMSIVGVKQMASNAKCNFKGNASDQSLASGAINDNLSVEKDFNTIAGTSMTFKYGSKYYNITLPENSEGYDYGTVDAQGNFTGDLSKVAASLNKALGEVSIGDKKTLADVINVTDDGSKITFNNTETAGNKIEIVGSTGNLLSNLGFVENQDGSGLEISASGLSGTKAATLAEKKSIAAQIGGKQVAFTYNGKTEWITLASEEELKTGGLEKLKTGLQSKLDKAFGKGRIEVTTESVGNGTGDDSTSKIVFKTTEPKKDADGKIVSGDPDNSSVLSIGAGERGLFGKYGALTGIAAGDSNRLNLDVSLEKAGLFGKAVTPGDANNKLEINGVEIEGITKNSTLREVMDAVNKSDAGVKMSYLADADRFVVTSTDDGASGRIEIKGEVGEYIFNRQDKDGKVVGYDVEEGKDAIIAVKYEGSADETIITRGSNSFNLNGMTINVKGTFGYKEVTTGGVTELKLDDTAEPITFDVTMDTEPATTAVKEMVEAFNEMVKLINDEVSTKPNRKYDPLTSEEEDEMSESQIKAWNEKAKAGLLFNDSDVRALADSLRSIVSKDAAAMKKMGISVSTSYSDNGKIVFDEEAFKSALATDPEAVLNAFTRPAEKAADGTVKDAGGLMVRLQTVMNKYASTTGATKGILIERAGSQYAPTSILTNSMQKQMDEIDDNIERLLDKLETEQDRYISQFTTLETLISQMNSQSSWLASSFGG